VLVLLATFAAGDVARAQASDGEWSHDLALYLFATGMSGEVGAGGVAASIDESFSDIVDNLEIGAMGGYSATNGKWVVLTDAVFAGLGATAERTLVDVEVDVDLLILEGDVGYVISKQFQLFGGVRYVDVDDEVVLTSGPFETAGRGGESWVDPVVGARFIIPVGERGTFWLRGDVGGFGVGSDLTWNAVAGFAWELADRFSVGAGYRVLDFDYDHGSGADRFLFDVQLGGPVVGLLVRF
jgi:hypothetical protein